VTKDSRPKNLERLTSPAPPQRPAPSATSPAALGFRMPGEFQRQACVWMAWPGARTRGWADPAAITAAIARIAHAISRFEKVRVAVDPEFHAEAAAALGANIEIMPMPVDDIWARDSGPSFLLDARGGLAASTWNFNAWGNKFAGHEADITLAARIAAARGVPSYASSIITEGGALHVDGEGTLVATESSILNDNRNRGLARSEVEEGLKAWLGVDQVIWIPGESEDSITDGHIDGLMTFVRPGAALFEVTDDTSYPTYHVLKEQLRALELATDARGRRIEVQVLKRPRELPSESEDFCGIYVNCLIVNGAVLIPAFGDLEADAAAARVFASAFPGREIVALRIDAICEGGGGIHCVTQQEPASNTS
jgi:agmatine deiminase